MSLLFQWRCSYSVLLSCVSVCSLITEEDLSLKKCPRSSEREEGTPLRTSGILCICDSKEFQHSPVRGIDWGLLRKEDKNSRENWGSVKREMSLRVKQGMLIQQRMWATLRLREVFWGYPALLLKNIWWGLCMEKYVGMLSVQQSQRQFLVVSVNLWNVRLTRSLLSDPQTAPEIPINYRSLIISSLFLLLLFHLIIRRLINSGRVHLESSEKFLRKERLLSTFSYFFYFTSIPCYFVYFSLQ